MSRTINLTTPAPDIIAAIPDETLPTELTLSVPAAAREMFNMKTRSVNLPHKA